MPGVLPDRQRFEQFLGTAGSNGSSIARDGRQAETLLAQQIFRREMGREIVAIHEDLLKLLDDEHSVDDYVNALRNSAEWFARNVRPLDHDAALCRQLAAVQFRDAGHVDPQIIAEVTAAFRLALGRDPDPDGFRYFARIRAERGLSAVVDGILASEEAGTYFAGTRPTSSDVMLAVAQVSMTFLQSAAAALTADGLNSIATRVADIHHQIERLAHTVNRLGEFVELRLDGLAAPT